MLHKYVNINESSTIKIDLNTDSAYTSFRSIRNISPKFIEQLRISNSILNFDPVHEQSLSNYSSHVRSNELQNFFPSIATLSLSVVNTDSTIKKIQNYNTDYDFESFSKTVLPIAVRYTDNRRIWLIERPPFKATIKYKTSRASSFSKEIETTMWIPWTQMLLISDPKMSEYRPFLFFSDGPISSLDELAIPCFFFNMYGDGSMCLSTSYTMLQQYLSENNTFDIATVYNFILNDYMTGGWNADLALNTFDSVSNYSKSARDIRIKCINGDSSKNIKPSKTPTGRISFSKYYKNFFTYFSSLELNEFLSLISNIKAESLSSNTRAVTFRTLIESLQNQKQNPISIFEDNVDYTHSAFTLEAIGFVHPSNKDSIQTPRVYSIMENLDQHVSSTYSSMIEEVLSNEQRYRQISSSDSENSFTFYINENFELSIINNDFDYSTMFSIPTKV